MKVIWNNVIPFGRRYGAINLFGVLFAKRGMVVTKEVVNHEEIHSAQLRELLFIPFYIVYVAEWLWRLVQQRGDTYRAYRSISFEREAYAHASDLDYMRRRRHFAQWRKSKY